MIYPAEADIVPLLKSLTESLQPYAKANAIRISFDSTIKHQLVHYQPFLLSQSVLQVICSVINLLPPKSTIRVHAKHCSELKNLLVEIENSGINLIRITGICAPNKYSFGAHSLEQGTLYRLVIPLELQIDGVPRQTQQAIPTTHIPPFYAEIQKRLRSHFTGAEKRLLALAQTRPEEATFLQRINTVVKANMDDECFDTAALSKAMCISRSQLFRRLKPLIRQAPAAYIKTMRLQRAKELLESTDLTISQVSFNSGFQNLSHFTKIFQKKYGMTPSVFRRN